jgi:hypothetical protein
MAQTASTPQGLDQLMQGLGQVQQAQATGSFDPASLLNQFAQGSGSKDMAGSMVNALMGGQTAANDPTSRLLSTLFGSGGGAVTNTLDRELGFKVGPLIAAAAPFVMGLVSKQAKEQNLDAQGVANMLQNENQAFMSQGGEPARMVQRAQQAGQDANALKGRYSDQEWSKVRLAPLAGAALVIQASPSSAGGVAKEVAAALGTLEHNKNGAEPASLLSVAFDAPLSDDEMNLLRAGEPSDKLTGALHDAAALVDSNAHDDLTGYRNLVVQVATATAEADHEGGFLGLGAKQISDAEAEVLKQVAAALGA